MQAGVEEEAKGENRNRGDTDGDQIGFDKGGDGMVVIAVFFALEFAGDHGSNYPDAVHYKE